MKNKLFPASIIISCLLIVSCTILNNPFMKTNLNKYIYGQYPMIYSYTANPSLVKTRHNTTLSVRAANHENVDLSYTYEIITGTGSLSGEGKDINYHTEDFFTDISVKTTVYSIFGWTDTAVAGATIRDYCKISDTEGGFTGGLDNDDDFGYAVELIGDLDADGIDDIAVGALYDDDGGNAHGAVWILFMNADGTVRTEQKISDTQGGFTGMLDNLDRFGEAITCIGDFDKDGVNDIVVGTIYDDDGGTDRGAIWILFLNSDGTVKLHQKISDLDGNFSGVLSNDDLFGHTIAPIGDFDNDGIRDIAVGAHGNNSRAGAIYILFLNSNGTVKTYQKITEGQGGFSGDLDPFDHFGTSITYIGDLDSDGITELAVSAVEDDDGGTDRGAVWILFLNSDATVKSHQKISDTQGAFNGTLANTDFFGYSITSLGDLDGDGITDIAVGAIFDNDGGTDSGAVWILFLNSDGTVKDYQKISRLEGGFYGNVQNGDQFGVSTRCIGDYNKDGVVDIAVGARECDDGGTGRGAVWLLFLNSDGTVTNY